MATPATPPLPYNYAVSSVQQNSQTFNFVPTGVAPPNSSQSLGATIATGASVPLTNPTAPGLYAITVGTTGTDLYSTQSCLSLVAGFNGANWVLGGNGSVIVNGDTTLFSQIYTNAGAQTTILFKNATGQTLNGMYVNMLLLAHLSF
jgi:hypothetical protein